ncbi:response regulator transcription factor [Cystobacter fuscus]|uniref:response regulator transcription factor n=1 Tax=Cystobacter fuscus TaxID=43 RepID=UPI002B2F9633|nr:response regulator transcription factor [Cystobacter fuscus]
MRILIVEDNASLARGLTASFRASGFAVDHVTHGVAALDEERLVPYNLMILDVGLPDLDGFEVLRQLRQRGSKTPVLILTARAALNDKVKGLDLGADDYLLKPFEPAELEARVRALLRRGQGQPAPALSLGGLVFDRSTGTATLHGRPLELRRREWAVLESLMMRAGKVVTKERLSAEVFGHDEPVGPNALEVYVGRLRKKLEPDGPTITTIRGLGYLINAS